MTKIEASGGRLRIVPLHMYKRPGGGGEDCSDRPVIARLTDVVPVPTDVVPVPTDVVPVDPLCGRLTRATMMLATAATTAAQQHLPSFKATPPPLPRPRRHGSDSRITARILASQPACQSHGPPGRRNGSTLTHRSLPPIRHRHKRLNPRSARFVVSDSSMRIGVNRVSDGR